MNHKVHREHSVFIGLAVLLTFMIAACGGGSAGSGDPAKTVEQYLTAKINGEKETMRGLLCSALEARLDGEAQSFATVSGVTLEDMKCTRDGETDVVRCEGKIVAQYGTEQTEFPLTSYAVVQEDGEWKWCGETAG